MPELPEVETVRRYLDTKLPGDRITAVTVDLPRLIKNRTEDAFRRTLILMLTVDDNLLH